MKSSCINELKEKINKAGFNWEKSVKDVEGLLESIKMNIKSNIRRKKELKTKKLNNKNNRKLLENNMDEGYKSGILIAPSQIINFDIDEEFEFLNNVTNDLNNVCYAINSCKYEELGIFDEKKINNPSDAYYRNSIHIPSLITKKSPSVRTSSSVTFLSKAIAFKKRRLIVPQINARVTRKKIQNKYIENQVNTIKPKRKLKLRGDNYSKEYYVYRDEDYGIVDDTDDVIIETDYVHKQDDDRQTTSEVQEWAIGLIRRYIGETEVLFRKEDIIQTLEKSERIRSLRQRFGFSTKVK
ncbi:hypothetical protein FG386_002930 [Cryptosporidium ryanae]|uniref:uncharacterized protein n=1 Tax=Cryptosporidium ryanae TaxID=515981 RepID=UPI00351AAD5B|nr:hypothetical protein FG386_002930 [Cryptosporidium ryanae]